MKKLIISFVVCMLALSLAATVRVVTYNALNFGDENEDRLPFFETVLNEIDADILLFQEIEDGLGGRVIIIYAQ